MSKPTGLMRLTAILLLTVLISACGGTGNDTPPREDPPPQGEFVLNVTGELLANHLGHGTHIAGTWLKIDGPHGSTFESPPEAMSPVLTTGPFSFDLDARDYGHATSPELYGGQLMSWDTVPEVTDSEAELKILLSLSLNQTDPNSSRTLPAFPLTYRHDNDRLSTPVWSDRPTVMTGSSGTVELDITLQAGWNLVTDEGEGENRQYRSRPVTAADAPGLTRSVPWQALGTVSGVEASALFAANRTMDGAPLQALSTQFTRDDGTLFLTAQNWLTPSESARYLTSLAEALDTEPGNVDSGASARFVLGRYLGFSTTIDNWWQDPQSSSGEIYPLANGNRLVMLYADRSDAITFSGISLAGGMVATGAAGTAVNFGWNLLELVPDPAAGADQFTAALYTGAQPTHLEVAPTGSDTLLLEFSIEPDYYVGSDTRLRWTSLRYEGGALFSDDAEYRELKIGSDGQVSWNVEAASINNRFGPAAYADRYFRAADGASPSLDISAPDAELKMITDLTLAQYSPLGEQRVSSYLVYIMHHYTTDSDTNSTATHLVHSDSAVSISGDYQGFWNRVDVQVHLVPGWNLIYAETRNIAGTIITAYRARVTQRTPRVELRFMSTELAYGDVADPVAMVALYAAHQITEGTLGVYPLLWSYPGVDNSEKYVTGPTWLPTNDGQDLMAPLSDAFEFAQPGDIKSSVTDLRVALAAVRTFDESHGDILSVEPTGELDVVTVGDAHPVMFIYADRQAVVQIDGLVIDEAGTMVATSGAGLELKFGWNSLELIPAGAEAATDFAVELLSPGTTLMLNHTVF